MAVAAVEQGVEETMAVLGVLAVVQMVEPIVREGLVLPILAVAVVEDTVSIMAVLGVLA